MLSYRCMEVSGDITVDSLKIRGHLNATIKELIAEGIDPLIAVRYSHPCGIF